MKNSKPEIVSKEPTYQEIAFLEDRLYEYNAAKTKRADGKLFSKWIHDAENNIIAGMSGWIWAAACEITQLWVKDGFRSKGYGKLLLEAAEAEAKKNHCHNILLRTYSFQSPGFYQQLGYTLKFEIKDFPPGHDYFCFMKKLDESVKQNIR